MALYEALYKRQFRSTIRLFEQGEARQKSYTDHRVRDVRFMVGERFLLWVSPMKGVMRFGKKDKLSPGYHTLISSNTDESAHENPSETGENYEQHRFLSLECRERYYAELISKKVLPKSGIDLDNIPECLLEFHQRLVDLFFPQPCRANEQWVREF
ncbi:PREDICTED: uncharacterized protein LOC109224259 [Nicotiana attenuata]|uniref:uncharacterized protein LOC109224259 n=1 Tax=Nicotiana attenuata TaxID=49451 RepID=UPI000904F5DF|nr:PREDICTED: uncharacterized protein LOC109224259 [Nicotiana attenuata]